MISMSICYRYEEVGVCIEDDVENYELNERLKMTESADL